MNELSNSERKVMEVLWDNGELSNIEILNIIGEGDGWTRHTVKTYTTRMSDKGFLGVNRISPRIIKFYPLISKEKFLASQTKKFLKNNYSDLSYVVAGLLNNEEIPDDEIDKLEQIIKDYKGK